MFKYGSVRLFLIKFVLGALLTVFGLVYLGSLFTYDLNDPGFNTFSSEEKQIDVKNYFGIFGSYLSSYSIIIIGTLSYFLSIFIIVKGIKILSGVRERLLILKFISIFIGILFINLFLLFYDFDEISVGLFSIFITDILNENLYLKINNNFLLNFINFIYLVIGFFLFIFFVFTKIQLFKNYIFIFKVFEVLKYINIFPILFSILKRKKTVIRSKDRNEPTIKKGIFAPKKINYLNHQKKILNN